MTTITRSAGVPTGYFGLLAGNGLSGATEELDSVVQRAAEVLRETYGRDVTIRFNSDRMSGGAWIVTHAVDGIGRNAEIGITAGLYPDPAEIDALYDRLGIDRRELRRLCDALPRSVRISTHIGKAARRIRNNDEYGTTTFCETIETALEYLKANAILHESYP